MKKILIILGLALIAIIILWFSAPARIVVELSPSSPIKEGVEISFSSQKYKKTYSVPASKWVVKGTHKIFATAPGSQGVFQDVTVKAFETKTIQVSIPVSDINQLTDTNPGPEELEAIPYYTLFPHEGGDYLVTAVPNYDKKAIEKIIITIYHQFSPEEQFYAEERQLALSAAQSWLKENGVPESIPQEVIDK